MSMENKNKIVRQHCRLLENSNKTFEDIFNVMFLMEDHIFIEYEDKYKIVEETYGQIKNKIKDVAFSIEQKLQIKNQYIALAMENSSAWIITFWAILMSGNKPYLLNLRHPKSLSEKIMHTLNIQYVISLEEDTYLGVKTVIFNQLDLVVNNEYKYHFGNEIALSTSATSLKEKIVFYKGENFAEQILNARSLIKRNPILKKHYKGHLKLLAFLPFYHIFGLIACYFWFCFFGRTVVLLKDYSPDCIIRTIKKHQVTHVFAVPLLWHTIEQKIIKKVHQMGEKKETTFNKAIDFSIRLQNIFPHLGKIIARKIFKKVNENLFGNSVVMCISGGSYIKDSSLKLINALGYPLFNGYGMSEIGITSVELRNKPKYRLLNSIGKPLDSVQYYIKDNVLFVKGKSTSYKLCVDGEYINNDDIFNTCDVCKMDDKGYFYILGRNNDIVISDSGENINPDLIEKEFILNTSYRYSILGLKNSDNNDELSLVIELDRSTTKMQIIKLIDEVNSLNNQLDLVYRIKHFYFTYDLISSQRAIKVSRSYLINGIKNKEINLIDFKTMQDLKNRKDDCELELVDIIKEIFADVLHKNIEEIDNNAHFFNDLGGTSLDYFDLISKITNRFDVSLNFSKDEVANTVNELAIVVGKKI